MESVEKEINSLKSELRDIKQILLCRVSPWLSLSDAAHYANCSKRTLFNLIESGEIQASKTGAKKSIVSVSRKSIDQYKEKRIYKPLYAKH